MREQAPRESFRVGDTMKALLLDIDRMARGPQLILSRAHKGFLEKLFEQEVPEIFEKIVRIESSAREPGARSKIAVSSRDRDVDPVGACVGMKGSRVQAVVNELQKLPERDPRRQQEMGGASEAAVQAPLAVAATASRFHPSKSMGSPAKLLTPSSSIGLPKRLHSAPSAATSLSRPVVVSCCTASTWVTLASAVSARSTPARSIGEVHSAATTVKRLPWAVSIAAMRSP